MEQPLGYEQIDDVLDRLGLGGRVAEYHGALCGSFCVREPDEIDPLSILEGAAPGGGAETEKLLRRFTGESLDAFSSEIMMFTPLLPDDEEELAHRVSELGAWCEGFLYGISTGKSVDLEKCSSELQEIVKDFTEFTRAAMDEETDDEIEENAYAELVEYIRVGAQLVYMELREKPPAPEKQPVLH